MKKHLISPQEKPKTCGFHFALCSLALGSLGLAIGTSATAQTITYSSELNIPYGHSYRDENTPYNPSTRTTNGNRLIINGRMVLGDGSTLPGGLGGDFFGSQGGGSAGAIGNQLNVVTQGSWNTVIIDSTQINNGDQTVNVTQSDELNGGINLND
ncbi:MAG: holdfast attachment protein HfaA [Robiginitomaculum sp.]|nr:MAG: holdfast attachment protein HfaA [Robiginitomaculum sp.]